MPLNRYPGPTLPDLETQREGVRERDPNMYGLISGALPPMLGGGGGISLPPSGGFINPPPPEPIQGGTQPMPADGTGGYRPMPIEQPRPMPMEQPRPGRQPARGPRDKYPGAEQGAPPGPGGAIGPVIPPRPPLPDAFKGRVAREGGLRGGMITNNLMPTPTSSPMGGTAPLDTSAFPGRYTPTRKPVGRKRGLGGLGIY